jgi:hypothetical protein
MITLTHALLIGLLGGTMGTTAIFVWLENRSEVNAQMEANHNATLESLAAINGNILAQQIEIQNNLTAPDLLAVACSNEYLTDNGDLLCREMFCRLQTRAGDGASQVECEQMANIANTIAITKHCAQPGVDYDKCIDFVTRRK